MTKLISTSVVRGSDQGESHGGVYLLDLETQQVEQKIDWNTVEISWQGRGADRGLRGIAFDKDVVYIAASNELFAFTPEFDPIGSWKSAYLQHCHEIYAYERTLYLTSTGYDTILCFDLDQQRFDRAIHIENTSFKFAANIVDVESDRGPSLVNNLHLNSVYCAKTGVYVSGLKSGGMLRIDGRSVLMAAELPPGTHNARPFRDGVLFNDTHGDRLRYCGVNSDAEDRVFPVPTYDRASLTHTDLDDSRTARQGFARGLCVISDSIVAAGSSPSTITVYDLAKNQQLLSVNLSLDIRNAIHGLEVWPY